MELTKRDLVAALAIATTAPSVAWAYPAEAAMWVVREGGAEVFLFGDSGPLRAPWTSARFEAAVGESAVVWKETPDAGSGAQALFVAKGVDPARPLSTWLTPGDHARVDAAVAVVGLPPTALERLKPWLAAVLLDASFRSHFGFKQDNGPEKVLTDIARRDNKPIRTEFPDEASIVDYFAGLSAAASVQALLRAVGDIEAGPDVEQRRAEAWAIGDQRPATEYVERVSRTCPDYYQALLVARNRCWAPRVRAMLDGGGTTFVLAGGDHLVGPDSVQNQLAAAGMRARRV
jgi:uncharacterized protein YbaP (TraB family)